jgi:uncharacterized protein (DUF983 family)
MSVEEDNPRSWPRAMQRGFLGGCPACGQGRLFRRFLKVADACPACGAEMHHHRADDFPAYATILVVGHIVVGLMILVVLDSTWPDWLHMMIWPPLALLLVVVLIQPIKGAIVGLQWALRMHGFGRAPAGAATDAEHAG